MLLTRPATLLKKRLWEKCFPVNFAKFLRTPFLQNASVQLRLTVKEKVFVHVQKSQVQSFSFYSVSTLKFTFK